MMTISIFRSIRINYFLAAVRTDGTIYVKLPQLHFGLKGVRLGNVINYSLRETRIQ